MSHLEDDALIALYYEDDVPPQARRHAGECDSCGLRLAELSALLDRIREMPVAEPAEGFEERIWGRVAWRLRSPERAGSRAPWLALAASLLLVAFLLGRLVESRRLPEAVPAGRAAVAPLSDAASDRVIVAFVSDHLDRTQMVLLELSNMNGEELPEVSRRAADLVRDNRLARMGEPDASIAALLESIEPLLIELSHAADDTADLERLRRRLELNGTLLRIRVVRAGLVERMAPRNGASL